MSRNKMRVLGASRLAKFVGSATPGCRTCLNQADQNPPKIVESPFPFVVETEA